MADFTLPAGANRRQLLAEIRAAFPALAPTPGADGRLETEVTFSAGDGVLSIGGLPETVDPVAIQAVIDAHVPQPPALDAEDIDQSRADQAKQQMRAYVANDSPTAAETVAVVKTLCRVALWSLRARFRNGG